MTVPESSLIPVPDHIDDAHAAAFPLSFLTAWHMLITRARLRSSDTVLVLAAGSGVGQAAVQIAKTFRSRVIATAGSDAKLAKALELGADEAVNHHTADLVSTVKGLTANRGVDIVVEHVGMATWEKSVRCLARGGRVVTCGATTGHQTNLDLRHLFARQLSMLGSYMGAKAELLEAAGLFVKGVLNPVLDRSYALKDAAQAQMRLESSEQFGKIILVP